MTTVIRYVGLQPKSELAITGLGRRWWPGELRPLDDATARLLTLSGQGWEVERDEDTYLDETAVPGAGNTDPYVANNGATGYHAVRKAIAKVLAGQRSRILVLGDSTTVGSGAGTSTLALTGARFKSWCTRLAASLTAAGIPAYNEAVIGNQNTDAAGVAYNTYDPRWVASGGFAASDIGTIGSWAWYSTSNGANLAFTPGVAFDRFDVIYSQFGGAGSVTANVDGGATLATISTAGGGGVAKTTVSCTAGTHTINLTTTSTSAVYIIAVVPWQSTSGGIDIIQGGNYGATLSPFTVTSNPWNAAGTALLTTIGADIVIVQLTINDSHGGGTVPTYSGLLASLRAAHVARGSAVIWMSGIPSGTTQGTDGTQAGFVAAVAAQAAASGDLYLNLTGKLGTYAATNADGWMFDSKHGNAILYADEGRWVASALSNAAALT